MANRQAPAPSASPTAAPPDPPSPADAPARQTPRMRDKVAIVTGANSPLGIGHAAARQLAESGARALYLCDRDDDQLDAHRHELAAASPAVRVHVRRFDVADEAPVRAVVADALARYGRLDVFVANAGVTGGNLGFAAYDEAAFMAVLRTNTLSVFLAAKYAAPAMMKTSADKRAAGGSIIGTASVAGLRANAGPTPYSTSKAAVVSLARTMAYELAGTAIRVNVVCPGLVGTAMTAPLYRAARARGTDRYIGHLNPLKRGGLAHEVARVVVFLASDEAGYVNGQAWAVDGGLSAGLPYVPPRLA